MAAYPANDGFLGALSANVFTAPFILMGGLYQIAYVGAGSGGLYHVGPDGVTNAAVNGGSFGANGVTLANCQPGTYVIFVNTAGFGSVTKIKKS